MCSTNPFSAAVLRVCLPFGIQLGCLKSPGCRDETLAFCCFLSDYTSLVEPRDLREQDTTCQPVMGVSLEWDMPTGG